MRRGDTVRVGRTLAAVPAIRLVAARTHVGRCAGAEGPMSERRPAAYTQLDAFWQWLVDFRWWLVHRIGRLLDR